MRTVSRELNFLSSLKFLNTFALLKFILDTVGKVIHVKISKSPKPMSPTHTKISSEIFIKHPSSLPHMINLEWRKSESPHLCAVWYVNIPTEYWIVTSIKKWNSASECLYRKPARHPNQRHGWEILSMGYYLRCKVQTRREAKVKISSRILLTLSSVCQFINNRDYSNIFKSSLIKRERANSHYALSMHLVCLWFIWRKFESESFCVAEDEFFYYGGSNGRLSFRIEKR